ncbi:MAG: site-2 protease family protein, partial [Oscillospiraceae bacterium]|nr:site-2 protease family protein [Oscillospiraceae bacterium]
MPIVIAVVALCVIILIHELGHFGAARLFNMKVYQFNLGMGPILLKRKRGETQYALRLFPIGGSCMLGEDEDPGDDPREFRNNAVWKKMIVIAAGAFLNMVLGLVLAIIISIASPIASLTIADFPGASPISNTGASALMEDDTIVSVNGMRVFANPEIAYKMDNTLMRSAREGGGANVSEHSMTVSIFGYGSMSNTGEYALQPDDRIVSIGGVEITSAQHIYEQLQQIVNSGAVLTHEREEADGSVTVINYVEAEMLVNRGSLEGLPVTLSAVKIPFRESGESRVLLRDFFVKAVYEFVVIRNGEKITLPEVVFAAAPNERGGISYV